MATKKNTTRLVENADEKKARQQAINDATEAVKIAIKDAQRKAQLSFLVAARKLMSYYPELTKFQWQQYTPYFNDGDPCEFCVYNAELNGYSEWKHYPDVEKISGLDEKKYNDLSKIVDKFIAAFDEEEMRFMFGDHVLVSLNPFGITTEAHKHE